MNKSFNLYSKYYDLLYAEKNYQTESEYIATLILKYKSEANKIIDFGSGIYQEKFAPLSAQGYQLPMAKTIYADNIYWVFGIVAPTQAEKERIVQHLTDNKIGSRPFFWCMHEQPVFRKMGLFKKEKHPVAEKLSRNGFYIPSGLGLSNEDINTVIETIFK